MANKLHEILAIEQDRKTKANQAVGESKKLFTKSATAFDGMVKKYTPTEENAEEIPEETKEVVTTVKELLDYTLEPVIVAMDATLSKEETNASGVATAELILNEKNFGTFSATTLLALEAHLVKLLDLYKSIPILDTTRKWVFDEQNNFYRTAEEVKFRTIKRPKVIVKYEATEKHPAQTELLNLDFQVGRYETTYFSGRITPTQKSKLVDKLDNLIEAVKIARAKANNVEVKNIKIGKNIFDFLHEDIF
ncbi:MAG: hypothetical protein AAF705_12215 [Bacteroidota bacterium]